MLNRRGGSRTDTLLKLTLMFFVILLSFSAGTFLGKQFSDSQHKLNALENNQEESTTAEHEERETASVPPNSLEVKPEDALTDEDIAKLSEEFSNKEKDVQGTEASSEHSDTHAAPASKAEAKEAPKDETEHGDKLAKELHGIQKAAERVAKGQEPTENKPKAESRIPSSLPGTATSVGKFTIQVSSYQSEEDAQKHAEALKGKGFSAFYISADVKGTKWYRVSVGLFATKAEANTYMSEFKKQANVTSALVQKIVQ